MAKLAIAASHLYEHNKVLGSLTNAGITHMVTERLNAQACGFSFPDHPDTLKPWSFSLPVE
jgi:hypothetical protein